MSAATTRGRPATPVREDEVVRLAARAGAAAEGAVQEFLPRGSVRTFRVGHVIVRVDEDPAGEALRAEGLALCAIATAVPVPIAPRLVASGTETLGGEERHWLCYPFVDGNTLSATAATEHAARIGTLFATLHGAHVFDLRARFPRQRPMTLMEAFKRTSDQLRGWMLAREADGLAQDLLTLTLADLQRALRQYAMALDHVFLTARRRVLCHGRPEPSRLVLSKSGELVFVGLEAAVLGDAAEDLAAFSIAADLSPDAEQALLDAYLDTLEVHGRDDPRFLPRFFARRMLGLLSQPVRRLDRLRRLKEGALPVVGDPVVTLEEDVRRTYDELVRAINGLRDLVGGMRPVSLLEVESMGRLIAYEEMILHGRVFRIAVTGLPYAGKTEVGATLARRLSHAYVNTSAVGRALALKERRRAEAGEEPLAPRALVKALFDDGFEMQAIAEAPYYEARLGGEDITLELHSGRDQVRGAALLDEEIVQSSLRDELSKRHATEGIVVEGAYAQGLLPGRIRHFHLTCAPEVRRARLMSHRPEVESDAEADALLTRLDEGSPPLPPDAVVVDLQSRPAASAALEILWHLLPKNRRPRQAMADLSGRTPLYSS